MIPVPLFTFLLYPGSGTPGGAAREREGKTVVTPSRDGMWGVDASGSVLSGDKAVESITALTVRRLSPAPQTLADLTGAAG
jgi:hypothetical protein